MLGALVDHTPKPRVALEAAEAHRLATVPRPYLAYISPISRIYLAHISLSGGGAPRGHGAPALMLTLPRPLLSTPTPEP